MSGRIKTFYRGWDITVRCLKTGSATSQASGGGAYTASAVAVLRDQNDSHNWVDARSQRTSATRRIFDTSASCAESLLEEVKILIDSMRKPPRSTT